MKSQKINLENISALLADTGQFSLVEWCLQQNILPYATYEQWRAGHIKALDEALNLSDDDLSELLSQVQAGCEKLKLQGEPVDYFAWQGQQQTLLLSRNGAHHKAMGLVWKRPEDVPQMDLFMDNSAVISENQLHQNLAAKDYGRAQATLAKLTVLNAKNPKLGAYQDLINYGHHTEQAKKVASDEYAAELDGLIQEVMPLAKETLKGLSRDYLAAAWRRLAASANQNLTEISSWQHHPSFALSQIPDWSAVQVAIERDPEVYRSPELLRLLSCAYFYGPQPQLGFLMWGIIAERYPEFTQENIGRDPLLKNNLSLTELWDDFLAFDDHWPAQWFFGYLIIQKPGLIHLLDELPKFDSEIIKNTANQNALALVKAKINDEDQKLYRAQLKSSAPTLFKCFMNKRDWYVR